MSQRDRAGLWVWVAFLATAGTALFLVLRRLVEVDPLFAAQQGEALVLGLSPVARFDLLFGVVVVGWLSATSLLLARKGSLFWVAGLVSFFLLPGLVETLTGVSQPQPMTLAPWQAAGFHFLDFDLAGLTRFVWLGSAAEVLMVGLPALLMQRRPGTPNRPFVLLTGFTVVAVAAVLLGQWLGDPGLMPELAGVATLTYTVAVAHEAGRTRLPSLAIALVYALFLGGGAGLLISSLGLAGLARGNADVRTPPVAGSG